MKKVIVEIDSNGMVFNPSNPSHGLMIAADDFPEYKGSDQKEVTLQLVKQGVTVDEIIKLKNADLL